MKSLLIAAAVAATAQAACPNQCSGHGTCSGSDLCSCYATWMGADCSQRKCAEDRAWAVNNADPHAYTECSGQGVCNRQSGECECFDGFTGRACARSSCPNDCSGHGQCKLLAEVDTTVAYDAGNWDARRIQTCECDAGYFGSDCSMRKCPTGDDPLTLCTSTQNKHIQEVRFTLGSATLGSYTGATPAVGVHAETSPEMALFVGLDADQSYTADRFEAAAKAETGAMRITYTDSVGGAYVANPVAVSFADDAAANTGAATALEMALESLPDNKVNGVTVASEVQDILQTNGAVQSTVVPQRVWLVTFDADTKNSNNVGLQNTLQCDSAYSCTEDGCQPKVNMPFLSRYVGTDVQVASTAMLPAGVIGPLTSYTGLLDVNTAFKPAVPAVDGYKYIRLNKDSQPQLPAGIAVDTIANKAGNTDFARYDIRVLVAVVDGNQEDGVDNTVDGYYTRVIHGHNNIQSADEKVGLVTGAWVPGAYGAGFNGYSLDGFTYNGPIPSSLAKVPVPGAPGVFIDFPHQNMVSNTKGQWFEILVKLPNCQVTPVTATGATVTGLTANFATAQATVDVNVENIECSGRGQCNRKSGQCECYQGYYGLACNRQTTLV